MARSERPAEERDGVELTNLDKPLFDGAGATKRDLVDYLWAMSAPLVADLHGRPLSVIRVRPGQEPFMQKNLPSYAPPWIKRVSIWAQASRREVAYPLCDDRRTLMWFGNQRAVEYHPTLFRVDPSWDGTDQDDQEGDDRAWEGPAWLVLDIDPPADPGTAGPSTFPLAVRATALVGQVLADAGLAGAVKTSGAKGLHVFVPVRNVTVDEAAAVTRALAARAERLDPALATTAFIREDRGGKVFVDSTRSGGASVAAAYSPRARPGTPVSFPLPWAELDRVAPADFTVHTVPGLVGAGDPWADLMPPPQPLSQDLIEEGRAIPVARVQAMHEGKRRAREARRPPKT